MSRYNLNLKFLDKESVLLQSINNDCSSSNLSDVKIISKHGDQVFLHRIILAFAFPQFSEMFPEGDSVTILIDDVLGEDVINARQCLYQNGDPEPLAEILEIFGGDCVRVKSEKNELTPEDLDVDLVEDNIKEILNQEKEKELIDEVNPEDQTDDDPLNLEELAVEATEARSDSDVIIGKAKADFNINESLVFSHNYFRRGENRNTAECLMCELSQKKTLLNTTAGNTTGLHGHLRSKHPEYRKRYEQKKAEIQKIKAQRRSLIKSTSQSPSTTSDDVNTSEIGESKEDFKVFSSVLFSHNFYKRGNTKNIAECLMCEKAEIKTLLRTTDKNTTGLLNHLRLKHPEYMEKFEQKKAEVKKLRAERKSGTLDTSDALDVNVIGEAKPYFNLHESVLYSHNYFKRGKKGSDQAECLVCGLDEIKTFIRTQDGNTKGLSGHLASKHFEYYEQFALKKAEVQQKRNEKRALEESYRQ